MGFNFQAGHPNAIFGADEGALYVRMLQARFGPGVRLGDPSEAAFCVSDELGWSWWQELQELAAAKIGEHASRQIRAVDAWHGVYVDAAFERDVLRFPDLPAGRGPDDPYEPVATVTLPRPSLAARLLTWLGLRKATQAGPAARQVMSQMIERLGTRKGERDGLQVANLGALARELEALLAALGLPTDEQAVEALRRSYSESDDKIDDDPAFQCLCHALLTARYALAHGTPMWAVK